MPKKSPRWQVRSPLVHLRQMWWPVSFWRWQQGKGQRRQKTNQNAFCSKNSSIVATKVIYNCSVILGSWGSVFNFQEWVRFRCSDGLTLYKMGYIYPKDDKTHRVFYCIMNFTSCQFLFSWGHFCLFVHVKALCTAACHPTVNELNLVALLGTCPRGNWKTLRVMVGFCC